MKESSEIKQKILRLPNEPGIYKYFNKDKELIYVGKAKDLKKRVSSYFTKSTGISLKTRKLVSEISDLEYIVVNTEFDALLLENNLIKENQPKYNILLKDDKSYPFICISSERFPRVFSTRRHERNEGEYYGPYSSVKALNNLLELINKLYTIRTCNYNLSEHNINQGKFKICLEYHVKNCLGPCEGFQSEQDYMLDIQQTRSILKGNLKEVESHLTTRMTVAASSLEFEKAQELKEKIDLLQNFQSKSIIFNKKIQDTDIITITQHESTFYINYTKLENGMINISESIKLKNKLDESTAEILSLTYTELRQRYESTANLVLSNLEFDTWNDKVILEIPKIGDKKKLVELSYKNVLQFKKEDINKRYNHITPQQRVVQQLKDDLKLKALPNHIECFDNSNIQGTNPVASMVCFKNGKPSKKDYRHFKIKTVIGPDDFSSMNEIVTRRYKRLIEEDQPLPNLIIIDGGKGQLSAACDALKKVGVYEKIPIVGIAKKLEEIYYPEDSIPVHISKKSESLRLIQHLRDEAHRFAITFHRSLRSKGQTKSELDEIQGIGPKTKTDLLKHFKSFKKIKEASLEDLKMAIPKSKAEIVFSYIQKKRELN
ncbi:excinuclease ABC subunit UvrC [Reichenbachiella versicolor]|uniref:excinuclease ABC subunit UvrC n=1 Tax=Reichenbachiella versicolor TaxID=1821036 RepID=UPI000D6E0DD5|nr:excinuclease ABC subunit UvrC [Reichenbachiella versicolor]